MRLVAFTAYGVLLCLLPDIIIGGMADTTISEPPEVVGGGNDSVLPIVESSSSSCDLEMDGSCPPPSTLEEEEELGASTTRSTTSDHDVGQNEDPVPPLAAPGIVNQQADSGRLEAATGNVQQQQQQQPEEKKQAAGHSDDEDEDLLFCPALMPGEDIDDDYDNEEEELVVTGFGVPQQVVGDEVDKTRRVLAQMEQYMHTVVHSETFPFYELRDRCANTEELCAYWAAMGECQNNADYMNFACAPVCQSCEPFLRQHHAIESSSPETTAQGVVGLVDIGYGVPQEVGGLQAAATHRILGEIERYMQEVVFSDDYLFKDVREECQNRHELCAFWATAGECHNNANFMQVSCAPACKSCEQLLFEHRCRVPDRATLSAQNIWKPGDLNVMFERIVAAPEYNSTILLRPNDTIHSIADSNHTSPPWVVFLDDFLTPLECNKLIELGSERGYEVSRDMGPKKFDGTYDALLSKRRTSSNTWCEEPCLADPIAKQVVEKIERLTGIPDANTEYLQLLRYEVNQFYHVHHDYIEHEVDRFQGVRILTVFLYLNDVGAGGGTHFPHLNLTVIPKQGRALIWPSVFNQSPDDKDPATEHEALPVLEGLKFAANAWLHQRDFKKPFHQNCI